MAVGRFRRGQLDALAVAGLGEAWLRVTACGVAGRRSWQFAGHAAATASPPRRRHAAAGKRATDVNRTTTTRKCVAKPIARPPGFR